MGLCNSPPTHPASLPNLASPRHCLNSNCPQVPVATVSKCFSHLLSIKNKFFCFDDLKHLHSVFQSVEYSSEKLEINIREPSESTIAIQWIAPFPFTEELLSLVGLNVLQAPIPGFRNCHLVKKFTNQNTIIEELRANFVDGQRPVELFRLVINPRESENYFVAKSSLERNSQDRLSFEDELFDAYFKVQHGKIVMVLFTKSSILKKEKLKSLISNSETFFNELIFSCTDFVVEDHAGKELIWFDKDPVSISQILVENLKIICNDATEYDFPVAHTKAIGRLAELDKLSFSSKDPKPTAKNASLVNNIDTKRISLLLTNLEPILEVDSTFTRTSHFAFQKHSTEEVSRFPSKEFDVSRKSSIEMAVIEKDHKENEGARHKRKSEATPNIFSIDEKIESASACRKNTFN